MGIPDTVLLCAALTWSMFKAIINLPTEKKDTLLVNVAKFQPMLSHLKSSILPGLMNSIDQGKPACGSWSPCILWALRAALPGLRHVLTTIGCATLWMLCYPKSSVRGKKMKLILWGSLGIRLLDLFLFLKGTLALEFLSFASKLFPEIYFPGSFSRI